MDPDHHQEEERFYILLSRQFAKSISAIEKEELASLMQTNPEFRLKAELFSGIWSPENHSPQKDEIKEAYMRHLLKHRTDFLPTDDDHIELKQPKTRIKKKLAIFFSACLIILLTGFTVNYFNRQQETVKKPPAISSVVTRYGNKSKIQLPDGSQVWLNAGSRLDYVNADFTNHHREVYLTGEAFFDIVHNPSSPFIVRSGDMQIRVLGTSFNVKAYPEEDQMETSLIRGSVEITIKNRPDDIYILKPNEKLVINNERVAEKIKSSQIAPAAIRETGDIVTLKKVNYTTAEKLVIETAWVQNKLVFKAERFTDLAVKLERWYGIKIGFRNADKEELMFTGIFTTETITQALNAMRVVHPFHFSIEKNIIYIE